MSGEFIQGYPCFGLCVQFCKICTEDRKVETCAWHDLERLGIWHATFCGGVSLVSLWSSQPFPMGLDCRSYQVRGIIQAVTLSVVDATAFFHLFSAFQLPFLPPLLSLFQWAVPVICSL